MVKKTNTLPAEFPKSNGSQRKYLKDRLDAVHRSYRSRHDAEDTAEVKEARKVIERFERANRKLVEVEEGKLDRLKEIAKEAILFRDAESALRAVVAYEQAVAEYNAKT